MIDYDFLGMDSCMLNIIPLFDWYSIMWHSAIVWVWQRNSEDENDVLFARSRAVDIIIYLLYLLKDMLKGIILLLHDRLWSAVWVISKKNAIYISHKHFEAANTLSCTRLMVTSVWLTIFRVVWVISKKGAI